MESLSQKKEMKQQKQREKACLCTKGWDEQL